EPAAWAPVWACILQGPRPARPRWVIPLGILGVVAASAAAVILALVFFGPPTGPAPQVHRPGPTDPKEKPGNASGPSIFSALFQSPKAPAQPEALEVLPVATADESEIVRIAGADTETIVVGRMPLIGPMV